MFKAEFAPERAGGGGFAFVLFELAGFEDFAEGTDGIRALGESLPQFARRTGLKYSTLARWVQYQRPKRAGRAPRLRLLEAVVEPAQVTAPSTGLVLQLPGGVRAEVGDAKQATLAAALVRELARSC